MRPIRLLVFTLAMLMATLAACDLLESETGRIITLHVQPQLVSCVGIVEQQCMVVRQDGETEWSYFYDGIRGFTFEAGYDYTLQVLRRHVPNPPADASSYEYELIRIVSKEPAPQF